MKSRLLLAICIAGVTALAGCVQVDVPAAESAVETMGGDNVVSQTVLDETLLLAPPTHVASADFAMPPGSTGHLELELAVTTSVVNVRWNVGSCSGEGVPVGPSVAVGRVVLHGACEGLEPGPHTLTVQALAGAGSVEATGVTWVAES